MAVTDTELVARTRAILAYAGGRRDDLAKKAGIKVSDLKAWLDSSKPTHPGMEEVVDLAEAADVPRRFAERGFDDLREADLQDDALKRIEALEEQVRRLVARDARREVEAPTRTDATPKPASRSRRPPQR